MKKTIILIVLSSITYLVNAQKNFGLNQSNYSGTQGMMYNPAKIANSRNLFSLELFSVNAYANNNVFNINSDSAKKGVFTYLNSGNNQNISAVAPMIEVRLPSVSVSVGSKLGLGLSTRVRLFNQVHNANANVFSIYSNTYNGSSTSINDPIGFNYNIHAISDIGLTGSYKLLDTKPFKVNAGLTIRKYNGAGYFNFNNSGIVGGYVAGPPDYVNVSNIGIHLSTSAYDYQKIIDNYSDPKKALNNLFGNSSPGKGIGFDLGGEIIFNNNGLEENIESRKNINIKSAYKPYKLKLGVSLLDIGSLKYDGVKVLNIKGSGTLIPDSINDNMQSFTGLVRYFKSRGFALDSATINGVKTNLPTTLNIYADYSFTKNLFVSAAWMQNLVNQKTAAPFYYSQFTVAPRFESKTFDLAVPITYNTMSKDVKLGAAFRLGPLSVGSDDLSLLFKNSKGGNLYAALRIAINKKQKSKNNSNKGEIINNKYESRTDSVIINNTKTIIDKKVDTVEKIIEKIVVKTKDRDNDGIVDSLDKCPDEFGVVALHGCPDKDGDGIADYEDKCPNEYGIAALHGCPDKDGDGVADYEDKCPNEKGTIANFGCPEIKQEVKKRIEFAAKAIQFETGKAILMPISSKPLNEVVAILKEYTDYNLTIDGHTDNVGQADKNILLSNQRADAVKAYFIKNGINADRLIAKGFGADKPKVPNTTVINKAINRRVEMNLIIK